MLGNDSDFHAGDNDSVLFNKMLCQNDAMVSLIDGRNCAAKYFSGLAESTDATEEEKKAYSLIAESFGRTKDIICQMRELFGNWENIGIKLQDASDSGIRKTACRYIREAKKSDEEALQRIKKLL